VVPGVTAAFAAAAALGISLTDRRAASGVQFSTAHHAAGTDGKPAFSAASFDATQVIYMPGRSFEALAKQWLDAGASADLPCAVISRAAQPDQSVQRTTLGGLGDVVPAGSPTVLLAGWALAEPVDVVDLDAWELVDTSQRELVAETKG
jgi:siroheme synthase